MAALLGRVLASTLAKLGMANDTGVLAVEENILDILVLQVTALQYILKVGFGEACKWSVSGPVPD